jgi:hypothetical protein
MDSIQSARGLSNKCELCGVAEATATKRTYRTCIDCYEIIDAAVQALYVARHDGVPIYGPTTWREANMEHRLDHAAAHIRHYENGYRDEDHLAHAICDLVFVYATRVLRKDSQRQTTEQ